MKLGTISIVLVLPALLGALAWHSYVLFLYRVAYRLAWVEENLILSGILGCTYLFLGLCALALTSYYAVRTSSRWLIVKMGLSALLTLCSIASFFVGAYLGELWAVTGAKSYLDGVVRSANDYLQKNGEYPESLDKLDLPAMPRLIMESADSNKKQEYKSFTVPYQRIDGRSIIVGFEYRKGFSNDDCASYKWTTNNPRWVCTCHGCLTDNPNRR
jgi:hypothetical protein